MTPARGRCVVRKVETPESLPGAKIVLLQETRDTLTAQQAEIVAVGELAYCEDFGECPRVAHVLRENHELSSADTITADIFHPFTAKPGDWVLLAPRSLTEGPDSETYLVNMDDVLCVLTP